jgi:alpha-tubulin suppressor-like RCC1 family protein
MNNHLAAALDTDGLLTTWALKNTNTITHTKPISHVIQIALGDSSNQLLLTLSSSGVITDYKPGNIVQTVAVPTGDTAVAIAAGTTHNLAILRSGKLFAWGSNSKGETTIPISATMGISQITAGNGFSLALKSDGRVIGWGANDLNQTTIPISATVGVSQIAAGDNHAIALRTDGVVVAWGDNSVGQTTIPISATNVIYVTANANSSAAITRDGLVLVWGATRSVSNCCPGTSNIAMNSTQIMTNQMNTSQAQTSTQPASLAPITMQKNFHGLLPGRRYRYTLVISNERGSARYTGVFDTSLRYDQHYLPFITNTNADGVNPVNTTSGK